MKIQFIPIAGAAFLALAVAGPAVAQTTAFTYQGRLNDSGGPAHGVYDLRFGLYDSTTNLIAGPITNAAVGVTDGLFTVTLDFGAGAFSGANRWLEIAVRTNGAAVFSPLTPLQPITPSPYAVYALNAGAAATATTAAAAASVAATNIAGGIGLAQLPSSVVTNNAAGVTLTGAFNGNGGGLTNVSGAVGWQVVGGTIVQALPNNAYLLTNDNLVTLTLPLNPSVGDVVRISGAGSNGWQIAQNPGQSIVVNFSGGLDLPWQGRSLQTDGWSCIVCSSDGTKLAAAAASQVAPGGIYTSTNSGFAWTLQPGAPASNFWSGLASSGDGTKLVACASATSTSAAGQIYTSTDSGATWKAQAGAPTTSWTSVASSADGTKLAATVGIQTADGQVRVFLGINSADHIYTSTDSGVTWTSQPRSPVELYAHIASSADGAVLAAASSSPTTDGIALSIDAGVTWTNLSQLATTFPWVAMSADGSRIVVTGVGDDNVSSDFGATWTKANLPNPSDGFNYSSGRVVVSADGSTILQSALNEPVPLVVSRDFGQSWTIQSRGPTNYCAGVAMSADGMKFFAASAGIASPGDLGDKLIWSAPGATTVGAAGSLTLPGNSAIELQYTGNGQFLPISYTGGGYTAR